MENPPLRIPLGQLGEADRDLLLTIGSDAPRPFIGVDPKHPGQGGADRPFPTQPECLGPGRCARTAVGQIVPGPLSVRVSVDSRIVIGGDIGFVGGDQRGHQLVETVLIVGAARPGQ